MTRLRICFIGLGVMGLPMARRIALAGFDLIVYDALSQAREAARHAGLSVSDDAYTAAKGAQIVILMLPNAAIVRDVLLGEGRVADAAGPGALIVDMSTGGVSSLLRLGDDLAARQLRLMDVPVGRSKREAETGELLALAGGSGDDLARFRPVLEAMASEIVHVGGLGQGLKLKLVNNYMSMVNHVLTAEVLAMAHRAGLTTDLAVRVLSTTSAGLGQLNTNFPKKVLRGDVSPDFPINMGIKDLTLALELCDDSQAEGAFGALARGLFVAAHDAGFGDYDCTGVLHYLEGLPAGDPKSTARADGDPAS